MGSQPPPKGYWEASRRLAAAYVFIAPLVALYELGVTLDPRARNGADPIFREIFDRFSHLGFVFLNLVLLGLLFLAIWYTKANRFKVTGLYWYMLVEATVWACVLLGIAYIWPPGAFPNEKPLALPPLARSIVVSIGAGVYEETIFRFVLMGGMIFVLRDLLGGHPAWVVPLALVVAAALFSLAHHTIGKQAWHWDIFYFRTILGAVLGAIFWFRGLGIVVWVHALYNVALVSTDV